MRSTRSLSEIEHFPDPGEGLYWKVTFAFGLSTHRLHLMRYRPMWKDAEVASITIWDSEYATGEIALRVSAHKILDKIASKEKALSVFDQIDKFHGKHYGKDTLA